ncbi:hypothetical protein CDD83_2110 [Cordyceps sp. RAO-2017]|nr:hypothetical protein CDD83_2110 [Cordyceps sp. RAO-2017]
MARSSAGEVAWSRSQLAMTRSYWAPGRMERPWSASGWVASPACQRMRPSRPSRASVARPARSMASEMSTTSTSSAPASTARRACEPLPPPRSRTRSPVQSPSALRMNWPSSRPSGTASYEA